MTLSHYSIRELVPYVLAGRSGPDLIRLFNKYGARDLYDELGLPDIGKKNGQRPSRKEYADARLRSLSGKPELRDLLNQVVNEMTATDTLVEEFNKILIPENFTLIKSNEELIIQGGVIDRTPPVINEAHFQHIQDQILTALDSAKVSVRVVMAWFTNETILQKLVEKNKQGIDVQIAIYDDGVNRKHGVDISLLPHKLIKRGKRGGLMHSKFCVIDNQVVITGSYNWTNNAEFRNDENITIEKDPVQATKFSLEFRQLTQ